MITRNEYLIARDQVHPHLISAVKWPEGLISPYGRVPVEVGTTTDWADYVCYIFKNETFIPWLLVEVKKTKRGFDAHIAQAESYSLILDCPFFCVTDGNRYDYFKTGARQGERSQIDRPPLPDSSYLRRGLGDMEFPRSIDTFIDVFVSAHSQSLPIKDDTEWHERSLRVIRRMLFDGDIDSLTPEEFREVIGPENMMGKDINRKKLGKNKIGKIRTALQFIQDFKKQDDPLIAINRLILSDKKVGGKSLHLDGGGLFFVTQLLSAAHPDDYVALEDNVAGALRHLGVTSIFVHADTANGYLFINEICKKLYKEKIRSALERANLNYGHWAVHNFLWHFNAFYKEKTVWTKNG